VSAKLEPIEREVRRLIKKPKPKAEKKEKKEDKKDKKKKEKVRIDS